ncbi:hypothetical protein V2J09_015009 [Rumex salicifolius]
MANTEPSIDEYFPEPKRVRNPFVPIACDERCANCMIRYLQGAKNSPSIQSYLTDLSSSLSGALMTAGVLTAGLISFRNGNSQLGQKLMRARGFDKPK